MVFLLALTVLISLLFSVLSVVSVLSVGSVVSDVHCFLYSKYAAMSAASVSASSFGISPSNRCKRMQTKHPSAVPENYDNYKAVSGAASFFNKHLAFVL